MRLTADVVLNAHGRINPCQERELDLRALKIPAIENIGITQDQYDVIDFSDNEIKKLENFPRFKRLSSLLLSNNHIARIAPSIAEQLVNLETVILTNNRVEHLSEIDNLAGCKKLSTLSFVGNPVVRRQHYRLYVVHTLPSVKFLDFIKVKPAERKEAERLFKSAAGQLMAADVEAEAKSLAPEQMNPMSSFTADQRDQVRAAIAAASTPEDVDRIERQLKAGILPAVKKAVAPAVATPLAPSHASAMVVEEDAPAPPPHASDKEVADSSAPMPAAPVVTAPVVESVATAPVVVAAPVAEPVAAAPVVAAPVVEPVAAATVVVELPPIDQEPSAKSEAELKSAADCDDGEMKDESATTESFPILTEEEVGGMKVAELKAECTLRGLSTAGLKKALADRLIEFGAK